MGSKKILIVDDEPGVLALLETRLSSAGYQVVKADNGRDALFLASKEKPDLILLDIVMPGMDGAQVSEALEYDPVTRDIPVIFLTCLVTKSEEEKKKDTMAGSYYISKPYDPKGLLDEVAKRIG
jgi:CheY-like chemotaxis protein